MDQDQNEALQGVAIIGMAGRFPGADSIDAFWRNLREGVESVRFFTPEELRAAGIPDELAGDPDYVPAKAVIDGAELFDAGFFGYTPREATVMDPQHRLFLETAWSALEDSGHVDQSCRGPIGVFAGSSINTYAMRNLATDTYRAMDGLELSMSSDKDYLATRVAYKLNLTGPAVVLQTACSTSLVAVSMACQSLLDYQCDMALAGGVSVKVPRVNGYLYKEGSINSPDGHCRPFDAKAQGMVSGEGVAVVVLKRLQDAVADGDTIHAVIKGWAVNNDGSNKVGYTAPSVDGQAEVIALAQAYADVEPDSIGYVEAHGTGTQLGDPIEVAALTQAFRAGTDRTGFCGLGSVKSNIGHLDAAAGVTGLIKAALALERQEIPPSLHFERPSPEIGLEGSPFNVIGSLTPWPRKATPRRAGVSSFGIGGTNAHVVLEEAPQPPRSAPARDWQLLVSSARSGEALAQNTERLRVHLLNYPELNLADVAYTLQTGRRAFEWRAFQTRHGGAAEEPQRWIHGHCKPGPKKVAFVFPGQGTQYPGMGAGLYRNEPVYREAIDQCADILQRVAALDLTALLYPTAGAETEVAEKLRDTRNTQPALFATEYALACLWQSWGIEPEGMIGHSIGEYVAACLAGVMTLEDSLGLVAMRARLVGDLPGGAMLSVPLDEAAALALTSERISLAAVNAPQLCVLAGPNEAIDALQAQLQTQEMEPVRLHTSHAFHSVMLEPALESFRQLVHKARLSAPTRPFISNVTGDWITAEQATDPDYWVRHLRQTVLFANGVKRLLDDAQWVLLEVGPGSTLTGLARQQIDQADAGRLVTAMRGAREVGNDQEKALDACGRLWLVGVTPDWKAVTGGQPRRRVSLPTYAFERQRYWIEPNSETMAAQASTALARRTDIADWFYAPSWRRTPTLPSAVLHAGNWLVFCDESGLGDKLVLRLAGEGRKVTIVRAGPNFSRQADAVYALMPGNEEHYEALFAELKARGALPEQVAYLWALTGPTSRLSDEEVLERAFWGPLWLGRALGRMGGAVRLNLVSNGFQDVTGDEALCPEKATVLGPWRVLQQEYANISSRCVDIDASSVGSPREAWLLDQLLAEFASAAPAPEPIAYRGARRWTRSYEAQRLPASAAGDLRKNGVYLITGGLGGIGLAIALDLARSVSARLVLVGRSAMPARETWQGLMATRGANDSMRKRIERLLAIEAASGEVMLAQADSADESAMRAVVEAACKRFGAIHGVIHSAGVPAGGVIELKTRKDAAAILSAKVQGTRVLETLFKDTPLDFMVLCSSLTAVLGSPGQVDYTAANAYLDTFAEMRSRQGRTIAIAWDGWNESGMAVDTAVPAAIQVQRKKDLEAGLRDEEGVAAFHRALASGQSRVLVSTRDLLFRLAPPPAPPAEVDSALETAAAASGHERPSLSSAYLAPRNETEQAVAAVWQELFGIAHIGVNDNFLEIGGHSLLAIQIIARIDKDLGIKLQVNAMFESPTIAELAVLIEAAREAKAEEERKIAEMLDMIENLSDEEVSQLLAAGTGQA